MSAETALQLSKTLRLQATLSVRILMGMMGAVDFEEWELVRLCDTLRKAEWDLSGVQAEIMTEYFLEGALDGRPTREHAALILLPIVVALQQGQGLPDFGESGGALWRDWCER